MFPRDPGCDAGTCGKAIAADAVTEHENFHAVAPGLVNKSTLKMKFEKSERSCFQLICSNHKPIFESFS